MTRQEAIVGVKALLNCNYVGSLSGEDIDALNMAINSLAEGYTKEKVKEIIKDLLTDISTGFDKLTRFPPESDTDRVINQSVRMCETVVKNEVIHYLEEEIDDEYYRGNDD